MVLKFISFNVGPSRLYPSVRQYLQDAYDSGILSLSHRGKEFQDLYASVIKGFRDKLNLPADYSLYFTSSATECWSILAEAATPHKSLHLYSGAFGERWYQAAAKMKPESKGIAFALEADAAEYVPADAAGYDLVCLTHNETSNGTCIPDASIDKISATVERVLVAVDVTSSLGGVALPWASADVWFGSVQKCLGLPAGLGVMACSPRAIARFHEIDFTAQYNSLVSMHKYAQLHQTTHTPNVLGIYLLSRVLMDCAPIAEIDAETRKRAAAYYAYFEAQAANSPRLYSPLVAAKKLRSQTVIAVQCPAAQLDRVKQAAREKGLVLGSGYGTWKPDTFRIANFPALQPAEIEALYAFLTGLEAA